MKYALYYSTLCPFCQKVLMAMRGRQHDIELANTRDGTNKADLIQGGGKGQVPCLRIENEDKQVTWLYESNDILAYFQQHKLLT